jgi:hypothetical protein
MFIHRRQVIEKLGANQTVERFEAADIEWVLCLGGGSGVQIPSDMEVCDATKHHHGLDEQNEGIGKFERMASEKIFLGNVLRNAGYNPLQECRC